MKKIQIRNIVSLQQEPLTVAKFQANAATGTFCISGRASEINDSFTYTYGIADGVNQYAEVDFGRPMIIKEYRQYGYNPNNNDGVWKITYWDAWKQEWIDWKTGISTTGGGAYTAWADGDAVVETSKIRLVCTTLDSSGGSGIKELEVKY